MTDDGLQDLQEQRRRLRTRVDGILAKLATGRPVTIQERQAVDLKEEPGRRGAGGSILPGSKENLAAADHLAGETACMANTPGGGALIVGVADDGTPIGTDLDTDWLRHRIWERVDVAPAVEERHLSGDRLLVLLVAEAREPVEDPAGRIRWRVGDRCVPVDRSEWWQHRAHAAGHDPMAAVTSRSAGDITADGLVAARRYVRAAGPSDLADASDVEFLRRLGVLRPDGHLTQAGATVLCPAPTTLVWVSRFDVTGGDLVSPPPDLSGRSLLEQLLIAEERLDAGIGTVTVRQGHAELQVPRLPTRAVREAILNGVIHRDWMQPDPVTVTYIDSDASLEVVSPGGFVGGVSPENALTQRYARYPALSDLFRALHLVDKQGVGVDRMYREMIALGHRPPLLIEDPGPRVRTVLRGGRPVVPVMRLISGIEPLARQRDVLVAIIVHELLHQPFIDIATTARALQRSPEEARAALEAASECTVQGHPLIELYKGVWILGRRAAATVLPQASSRDALHARGVLRHRFPGRSELLTTVGQWLQHSDRVTTGDVATLTGLSRPWTLKEMDRLVEEGLLRRGESMGRNAHYRLA